MGKLKEVDKSLLDPTVSFCKEIRKSARVRGDKIANAHFEGDMAIVMGEVFGNMLACGVINAVGGSLWDVPMQM